jgi:beta-lactamase superfamily II metal-dependent hydrolase
MSDWELPERGVVFWPVGKADSVTIAVDADTVIQMDIYQPDSAADEEDDRAPVVDRLMEVLPRGSDGKTARLAVLAISHHDTDHCTGFDRLCQQLEIDEMWLTLRSFVEDKNGDGLTAEGQLVYDEAKRRRDAEIAAAPNRAAAGNRLRIIGREDLLEDADWKAFPLGLVTRAGQTVPCVNDIDMSDVIEVFVHTPFREPEGDDSRNSSCLGLRVTLKEGDCERRFLLLGDLDYKKIEAFIAKSLERDNEDQLPWDFLLAPHHGSRNAIMRKDENDKWVKADAYFDLEEYKAEGAVVIVSSRAIDSVSDDDTDPPHQEALDCYEGLVGKDNLYLTAEYAKGNDSEPLTIVVSSESCGECRESKAAWRARVASMTALTGSTIREGDSKGATGRQEFA